MIPDAPITWLPPATFDEDAPGLGLPPLHGITHQLIYDPKPCAANVDEGGDGVYESPIHGTFNHHPSIILYDNVFIVTWTNHSRDENGPGQRVLAQTGIVSQSGEEINFGDTLSRMSELAPQPVPVMRRQFNHDPHTFYPYATGSLRLINDSLYFFGNITACHGYTNREENRKPSQPLPPDQWSDDLNVDTGFEFDVWFQLGMEWVQKWRIQDDRLVPDSPMFQRTPLIGEVEITPGRTKHVAQLLPPYTEMVDFAHAPVQLRDDVERGAPVSFRRTPKYAPGTRHLAADGMNALAHAAEFRRPDDTWVVLRDNLLKRGHYYAAEKAHEDDMYPPANETNLYGGAQMIAGELADGRPWIICNSFDDYYNAADRSRKDMFLTLSDDGRVFDRTWSLLHVDRVPDGGVYKFGGPQYFTHVDIGANIWVVYSITKEQLGITKIPTALFDDTSS